MVGRIELADIHAVDVTEGDAARANLVGEVEIVRRCDRIPGRHLLRLTLRNPFRVGRVSRNYDVRRLRFGNKRREGATKIVDSIVSQRVVGAAHSSKPVHDDEFLAVENRHRLVVLILDGQLECAAHQIADDASRAREKRPL